MSTKSQGRPASYDLIDDVVDSPSSTYPRKTMPDRFYPNYSSLPSSLNKTEHLPTKPNPEHRDRLHSNSSITMMNNDERRKEIDLIIKRLYDGKLISTINHHHHHPSVDQSESTINRNEKGNKTNPENLNLLSINGDLPSLQRELQEKELDIIHLRKEIHELQLDNKLLKSKVPINNSDSSTNNNNQEVDVLRREKDILQIELRSSQELIAKLQQQQHQNVIDHRSQKIEQIALQQKEALEKKLKTYEKQIRTLIQENEKFQRNSLQNEGLLGQLKGENEELQQQLNETKKRNDELFYQEFHELRSDLKILKQRNNELFDENLRLQQRPHRDPRYSKVDRNESPNNSEASDSTNYLASVSVERYNARPSTSGHRSGIINGNNHHRTIRYSSSIAQDENNRTRTKSVDQQLNQRTMRSKRAVAWDEENIPPNEDAINYHDDYQVVVDDVKSSSSTYHSSPYPLRRSTNFNESPHHSRRSLNHENPPNGNNSLIDHRQIRRTIEGVSPRRPYAPSSIDDVHLNDVIKFSRPGGKIGKGIVKYIGPLPDRNDQYLGLELEDEESKHDGVYENQRFFHCKPNKGLFVAFNKVIMAWGER